MGPAVVVDSTAAAPPNVDLRIGCLPNSPLYAGVFIFDVNNLNLLYSNSDISSNKR